MKGVKEGRKRGEGLLIASQLGGSRFIRRWRVDDVTPRLPASDVWALAWALNTALLLLHQFLPRRPYKRAFSGPSGVRAVSPPPPEASAGAAGGRALMVLKGCAMLVRACVWGRRREEGPRGGGGERKNMRRRRMWREGEGWGGRRWDVSQLSNVPFECMAWAVQCSSVSHLDLPTITITHHSETIWPLRRLSRSA